MINNTKVLLTGYAIYSKRIFVYECERKYQNVNDGYGIICQYKIIFVTRSIRIKMDKINKNIINRIWNEINVEKLYGMA